MNVKLISIIAAVLVILGAGWWFLLRDGGERSASTTNQDNASQSQRASLNELLAGEQDLICTYSTTVDDGTRNSGTTYLAGGRMYGEFSLAEPGGEAERSFIIYDGQTQFAWSEGSTEGFKISLESFGSEGAEPGGDSQTDQAINQDQDFDFNCQSWTVEESRFTPPANVEFTDLSAQFEQTIQSENLRAVCEQLEDAQARATCEAAL